MNRAVALKQLRVDPARGRTRMLQEASSLARLSHPNIVSIFEFIELQHCPTCGDGVHRWTNFIQLS